MDNNDIKSLQEENKRLQDLNLVKSDMVSIGVHQIRTSLTAFKWIIKMFLDGDLGKLAPEQESLMQRAFEGNNRAISIVNELLLVNKTENVIEKAYEFGKLDMVELINNSIFDFSGEARTKAIELILLTPDEKLPKIDADVDKIRVVFQNILENGIKYGNPHSKIFITLKSIDKSLEVAVKNSGLIISEEGQKRIFEKFYRDPEAQKKEVVGSGIGLYTTKKIVEKHNGKIWFGSSEHNGTTFFFKIPFTQP